MQTVTRRFEHPQHRAQHLLRYLPGANARYTIIHYLPASEGDFPEVYRGYGLASARRVWAAIQRRLLSHGYEITLTR